MVRSTLDGDRRMSSDRAPQVVEGENSVRRQVPWSHGFRLPLSRRRTATYAYQITCRRAAITWAAIGLISSAAWALVPVVALPCYSIDRGLSNQIAVLVLASFPHHVFPSPAVEDLIEAEHPIRMTDALVGFGLPLLLLALGLFLLLSAFSARATVGAARARRRKEDPTQHGWLRQLLDGFPLGFRAMAAAVPAYLWTSLLSASAMLTIFFLPESVSDELAFGYPIGLVFVQLVPLLGVVWWGAMSSSCKRRVADHMARARCVRCGYDLRGTSADRCSECGMPLPPLPLEKVP